MQTTLLTIQIVGWNSEAVLAVALEGLREVSRQPVVIRYIDNGSSDNSVKLVRRALPKVEIIELPHNVGFAAAHNFGFARTTTPFVLTCDPDLKLNWPGIQQLLTFFDDDTLGAVQGKLLRYDDASLIDSAGIDLSFSLNGRERGAHEKDVGQYAKDWPITAATGACALYRMSALKKVADSQGKIFDEDFFSYKEDVDLGWRLRKAGWGVRYYPVLVGWHKRTLGKRGIGGWGLTLAAIKERLASKRTRYSLRNWVWMVIKNASARQLITLWPFILGRVFVFLVLSVWSWSLLAVWPEIIGGIPLMIRKRS